MQERTWGRRAERERRVIALQGGSLRPSAAGYLLFPLSVCSPSLSSFSPFPLQSMKALSQLVSDSRHTHTKVSTHTHTQNQRCTVQSKHWGYCDFIFILFFFCYAGCYRYSFSPHAGFSLCLCHYASMTQTCIYPYTTNTHTHTHTHCERISLMDSEDSNFPSATKDRKPSELNYPCLTHTRRGHMHSHTHTHTCVNTGTASSLAITGTHTHTSMRTLSHCDMPRITQSESRKQTERSISLRQILCDRR